MSPASAPTPEPPSVPILPPNASAEVRAFAADIAAAADALSWEEIERRSMARFPTPAASGPTTQGDKQP